MSKIKTQDELEQHKNKAISSIEAYLSTLISSSDLNDRSRADKLCYWLEDYMTYLGYEKSFSPKHLKRYKRGEIIKVHLGYNIGSEEGGLHYAAVLDKNNSVNSPTITIVPLTSVKPATDLKNLRPGNVYLGNELFNSLNSRIIFIQRNLRNKIESLSSVDHLTAEEIVMHKSDIEKQIHDAEIELELYNRMKTEILKMKRGSIALINQITTISKIRIYDPKTNHDVLSNIKLSNDRLDDIDTAIKENFVK